MQLSLLGNANFKVAKSLSVQETDGFAKDSIGMIVVFLGNTLEENKGLFLQLCVFNMLMDAATQMLGWDQNSPHLELKTQFWD